MTTGKDISETVAKQICDLNFIEEILRYPKRARDIIWHESIKKLQDDPGAKLARLYIDLLNGSFHRTNFFGPIVLRLNSKKRTIMETDPLSDYVLRIKKIETERAANYALVPVNILISKLHDMKNTLDVVQRARSLWDASQSKVNELKVIGDKLLTKITEINNSTSLEKKKIEEKIDNELALTAPMVPGYLPGEKPTLGLIQERIGKKSKEIMEEANILISKLLSTPQFPDMTLEKIMNIVYDYYAWFWREMERLEPIAEGDIKSILDIKNTVRNVTYPQRIRFIEALKNLDNYRKSKVIIDLMENEYHIKFDSTTISEKINEAKMSMFAEYDYVEDLYYTHDAIKEKILKLADVNWKEDKSKHVSEWNLRFQKASGALVLESEDAFNLGGVLDNLVFAPDEKEYEKEIREQFFNWKFITIEQLSLIIPKVEFLARCYENYLTWPEEEALPFLIMQLNRSTEIQNDIKGLLVPQDPIERFVLGEATESDRKTLEQFEMVRDGYLKKISTSSEKTKLIFILSHRYFWKNKGKLGILIREYKKKSAELKELKRIEKKRTEAKKIQTDIDLSGQAKKKSKKKGKKKSGLGGRMEKIEEEEEEKEEKKKKRRRINPEKEIKDIISKIKKLPKDSIKDKNEEVQMVHSELVKLAKWIIPESQEESELLKESKISFIIFANKNRADLSLPLIPLNREEQIDLAEIRPLRLLDDLVQKRKAYSNLKRDDPKIWLDPFHSRREGIKRKSGAEHITNAWLKCWEMLNIFQFFPLPRNLEKEKKSLSKLLKNLRKKDPYQVGIQLKKAGKEDEIPDKDEFGDEGEGAEFVFGDEDEEELEERQLEADAENEIDDYEPEGGQPYQWKIFCNAELPGSFILAINHYFQTVAHIKKFSWKANSKIRDPEKKALEDQFKLFEQLPSNWLMNDQIDGDILKKETYLAFFKSGYAGTTDLYTSDVGTDITPDSENSFDLEEIIELKLNFAQVLMGLQALKKGGSLICKTFTFFFPLTISLFYFLSTVFDEFYLCKPITSRIGNSEIYYVGKGFRGCDQQILKVIESALYGKLFQDDTDPCLDYQFDVNVPLPGYSLIPKSFYRDIITASYLFFDRQSAALTENTEFMKEHNINRDLTDHPLVQRRARAVGIWEKSFSIPKLPHNRRLIQRAKEKLEARLFGKFPGKKGSPFGNLVRGRKGELIIKKKIPMIPLYTRKYRIEDDPAELPKEIVDEIVDEIVAETIPEIMPEIEAESASRVVVEEMISSNRKIIIKNFNPHVSQW